MSGRSDDVRIGVIGCGGAAQAQIGHLRDLAGCTLTAVFDPKPAGLQRASRAARRARITDDWRQFLDAGVDAVSICSPNSTHADYAVRALRAGKHVLCEKPLSDSLDGCLQMIEAARAAPTLAAAVQHQMRFVPVHVRARQVLAANQLGPVSYVEGYYVHNVVKRLALNDTWVLEESPPPLVLSGCHFVDLLRWLLDDEVVEVSGMSNRIAFPEYARDDLSVVLLRFRSGVVGKVVTAFAAGRPQDHSLRVLGRDACIDNNFLLTRDGVREQLAHPFLRQRTGFAGSPLRRVVSWWWDWQDNGRAWLMDGAFRMGRRLYGRRESYRVAAYPLRMYEHQYAVRECLRDFVDCIRTGRRPRASFVDAARTVATCLAGVEACRSGAAVPVSRFWPTELEEAACPATPGGADRAAQRPMAGATSAIGS